MCNYGRNGCGRKEKPGATADGAQETEPAREGLPRLPAAVRLAQEMDAGWAFLDGFQFRRRLSVAYRYLRCCPCA